MTDPKTQTDWLGRLSADMFDPEKLKRRAAAGAVIGSVLMIPFLLLGLLAIGAIIWLAAVLVG